MIEKKIHTVRNLALKAVAGASLIVAGVGIAAGDVAQAEAVNTWFEKAVVHMDQTAKTIEGIGITAGETAAIIGLFGLALGTIVLGIGIIGDGIEQAKWDRFNNTNMGYRLPL